MFFRFFEDAKNLGKYTGKLKIVPDEKRIGRTGGQRLEIQPGNRWPMDHGPRPMAHGPWPKAHGPRPMAHGPWPMAHGLKIYYIFGILA